MVHCFICAKQFGRKGNMVRHVLTVHNKPNPVHGTTKIAAQQIPSPSGFASSNTPAIGIFQKFLRDLATRTTISNKIEVKEEDHVAPKEVDHVADGELSNKRAKIQKAGLLVQEEIKQEIKDEEISGDDEDE